MATFVMEHGLDHALIDELPAQKIKDPKLKKLWGQTHLKIIELLKFLGLETEYNLDD